ncbi:MAG: hypothetical protein ACR2NN_04340 [Bryobacteraceae bacterium]
MAIRKGDNLKDVPHRNGLEYGSMLLALFALAGAANLVPVRWNSSDPKSLDLLRDTPVNCVLLEPASWGPSFLKGALERKIAAFGVVHPGPDVVDQAHRATQLKLAGLVLEGEYESSVGDRVRAALAGSHLPLIELASRGRIRLDQGDPIVGTWQGLWPGVEIEHGGKVSMGPTSSPWINTNTGFLRWLHAATEAAVWLGERPPPKTVYPAERYSLAVADAAIAGARWIIALDDDLQKRLVEGDAGALRAWKQITGYVRYFAEKPDWREYRPYSEFALVQSIKSGGLLSSGLLDMLSVQHTAVRAVPTRALNAGALHNAKVVLTIDAESLQSQQKQDLERFRASGGTVINTPAGWHFPQIAPDQTVPSRKQMDHMQPVWEATYNATARKNFGVRTFNTASVLFHLLAAPDGKSLLVHLLNYQDLPAEDVTIFVLGSWHRARIYRPDTPVEELPVYAVKDGTGVDIKKISVLATLRLD